MLKELANPRKIDDEYRRIFSDGNFRLYIWYNNPEGIKDENEITGFQFCFEAGDILAPQKKSLSWRRRGGYSLETEDEGETASIDMTPILTSDNSGNFESRELADKFIRISEGIDKTLKEFVSRKILEAKL